jgi:hypothetical protein
MKTFSCVLLGCSPGWEHRAAPASSLLLRAPGPSSACSPGGTTSRCATSGLRARERSHRLLPAWGGGCGKVGTPVAAGARMRRGFWDLVARIRSEHDRRVMLTRAALVVSAMALLATSAPPDYFYRFSKDVDGPPAVLTSDAPQATFLVTLRVTGQAPNGSPVTRDARASATGTIGSSGLSGSAPFVNVSVRGTEPATGQAEVDVLTTFSLQRDLSFGTCTAGMPCETSFVVDFARTDGGDNGGTVSVDWSLALSASAHKGDEGPDEGPLELPWTVEIVAQ